MSKRIFATPVQLLLVSSVSLYLDQQTDVVDALHLNLQNHQTSLQQLDRPPVGNTLLEENAIKDQYYEDLENEPEKKPDEKKPEEKKPEGGDDEKKEDEEMKKAAEAKAKEAEALKKEAEELKKQEEEQAKLEKEALEKKKEDERKAAGKKAEEELKKLEEPSKKFEEAAGKLADDADIKKNLERLGGEIKEKAKGIAKMAEVFVAIEAQKVKMETAMKLGEAKAKLGALKGKLLAKFHHSSEIQLDRQDVEDLFLQDDEEMSWTPEEQKVIDAFDAEVKAAKEVLSKMKDTAAKMKDLLTTLTEDEVIAKKLKVEVVAFKKLEGEIKDESEKLNKAIESKDDAAIKKIQPILEKLHEGMTKLQEQIQNDIKIEDESQVKIVKLNAEIEEVQKLEAPAKTALTKATEERTVIMKKEEEKLKAEGVSSGGTIGFIIGFLVVAGGAGGGAFWWYKNKGAGAGGSGELQEN